MLDQIDKWTLLEWFATAGLLATVIGTIYTARAYYRRKESPKPGVHVEAKKGSIAAGRDVTIGSKPKRKSKKK